MRVLVCGGREYNDWKRVCALLDGIHAQNGITCIIQGGALGADWIARTWAENNRVFVENYPAQWENFDLPDEWVKVKTNKNGGEYNALAGFYRNQRMIDEGKPELVIGFPGDRGTADMLFRACKAEIPTLKVNPRPEDADDLLARSVYDDDGNYVGEEYEEPPPPVEWLFAPDPNKPKLPRRAPETPAGRYAADTLF